MKSLHAVQSVWLAMGLLALGCAVTKESVVTEQAAVPAGYPWVIGPAMPRDVVALRLSAPEEALRVSSYEHLALHGTRAEWQTLALHLEQTSLSLSPRAALALTRALCANESSPAPYELLWQVARRLTSHGASSDPSQVLSLETTLLTIARTNDRRSLVDLARALGTPGMLSSAALTALQAFPPSPLEAWLSPEVPRSAAFYRLQGLLHQQAAAGELRRVLLSGPEENRFAAAEALMRLGDVDTRELVLSWRNDPLAPPQYREFSERAIEPCEAETWDALRPTAVPLNTPECAALTLASAPDVSRGAALPSTIASWHKSLASREPLTQWCAAVALGLTAPQQLLVEMARRDVAFGSALGWLMPQLPQSSPLTRAAEAELARRGGPPPSAWAYGSLVHEGVRFRRSERFFLALAHSQGPAAPLGAEGLAERMTTTISATVRRLLSDPRPLIRAATAKGLSHSNHTCATGMLINRYALETSAIVRRALVSALALRQSRHASSLLERVAKCDPDPYVRRLASAQRPDAAPTRDGSRSDVSASKCLAATETNGTLEARNPQAPLSKPVWLVAAEGAAPPPTAVQVTDVTGRTVTLPLAPGSLLYVLHSAAPFELTRLEATTENPPTGSAKERPAAEWPSD